MSESYRTETVTSVIEFLGALERAEQARRRPWNPLWYRGQANATWELQPGLLRRNVLVPFGAHEGLHNTGNTLIVSENYINREFRRRAASLLPPGCDAVDVYFLAQHHGLPTRLLDWSTSALVGLFFAVESQPGEPGAVFAFEPTFQVMVFKDDCWHGHTAPLSARSEIPRIVIECAMGEREAQPAIRNKLFDEGVSASIERASAVVPVLPDLHAGRMLQQGACFTLHIPYNSAASIDARSVVKYEVPAEVKTTILRQLRELGVTSSSVFPDLDHIARDVCTEFAWSTATGLAHR